MPTAVKITRRNVEHVEDRTLDPEYMNNTMCGYALILPEYWEHKKYRLTVFALDLTTTNDYYNPFASWIYYKLKSKWGETQDIWRGVMYIVNEDDEKPIDFTLDDFKEILKHSRTCKYFNQTKDENDFLKLLNDMEHI